MNALFILNDAPYGSERVYNALRLAQGLLAKDSSIALTVFLLANAELTAKTNQKNTERLLQHRAHAETAARREVRRPACADAWVKVRESVWPGHQHRCAHGYDSRKRA